MCDETPGFVEHLLTYAAAMAARDEPLAKQHWAIAFTRIKDADLENHVEQLLAAGAANARGSTFV